MQFVNEAKTQREMRDMRERERERETHVDGSRSAVGKLFLFKRGRLPATCLTLIHASGKSLVGPLLTIPNTHSHPSTTHSTDREPV